MPDSKIRFCWLPLALLILIANLVHAEELPTPLESVLEKVLFGREYQVKPTPLEGLYEVTVGPTLYYFTGDGRHMLRGAIVDLASGENITESSLSMARKGALEKLEKADFIEFSAEKPKHLVTVFTDIDCGYCRKLHSEMGDYNAYGISVRYLAFPRAGVGSESYDKAVSVWCAANPMAAMDKAKAREEVARASCDNSVAEQFKLGEQMGIRGTPSIILEDGSMLRGYSPPGSLIEALERKS